MDRNCPNCGAPYDANLSRCPYCSTSYFDMSCIDIGKRRPFYLKLRYRDYILTAKVAVGLTTIEQCTNPIYYDERLEIDMHFTTVRDVNDYGKQTVFVEEIKKEV